MEVRIPSRSWRGVFKCETSSFSGDNSLAPNRSSCALPRSSCPQWHEQGHGSVAMVGRAWFLRGAGCNVSRHLCCGLCPTGRGDTLRPRGSAGQRAGVCCSPGGTLGQGMLCWALPLTTFQGLGRLRGKHCKVDDTGLSGPQLSVPLPP